MYTLPRGARLIIGKPYTVPLSWPIYSRRIQRLRGRVASTFQTRTTESFTGSLAIRDGHTRRSALLSKVVPGGRLEAVYEQV